jgi:hypothetical protein
MKKEAEKAAVADLPRTDFRPLPLLPSRIRTYKLQKLTAIAKFLMPSSI